MDPVSGASDLTVICLPTTTPSCQEPSQQLLLETLTVLLTGVFVVNELDNLVRKRCFLLLYVRCDFGHVVARLLAYAVSVLVYESLLAGLFPHVGPMEKCASGARLSFYLACCSVYVGVGGNGRRRLLGLRPEHREFGMDAERMFQRLVEAFLYCRVDIV